MHIISICIYNHQEFLDDRGVFLTFLSDSGEFTVTEFGESHHDGGCLNIFSMSLTNGWNWAAYLSLFIYVQSSPDVSLH